MHDGDLFATKDFNQWINQKRKKQMIRGCERHTHMILLICISSVVAFIY